jgi:very-short-patch-repair endonuclease
MSRAPGVSEHTSAAVGRRAPQPPEYEGEWTHLVQLLGVRSPTPVSGSVERRIAFLAQAQRGRVSRRQLLEAGVSSNGIDRRLRSGSLLAQHRGVYLVGHRAPVPLGDETSALLAVGRGAVLSHHSAAILWQLLPRQAADGIVHVLVRGSSAGRRKGVRIHRTRRLDANDVRTRHRLPVTSPGRVLFDLAPLVTERVLERAFDQALVERIMRLDEIDELLGTVRGRAGTQQIATLRERESGPTVTRSEAEERLLGLVRKAGLPEPRVNTRLHGYEVDFHWLRERLILEVDGFRYHSGRRVFEHDRRKDSTLQAAGFATMRVTWRQMEDEPYAVVARLAQALGSASERAQARESPGSPEGAI